MSPQHTTGRAKALINNATHLPSFTDLVAFRQPQPSARVDGGPSLVKTKQDLIHTPTPARREQEESVEIVGVNRATPHTPCPHAGQHRPHTSHHGGLPEAFQRRSGEAFPDRRHRDSGQGCSDKCSPRFLSPPRPHPRHRLRPAKSEIPHENRTYQERQVCRPGMNISSPREDSSYEPAPNSHEMLRSSIVHQPREAANSTRLPMNTEEAALRLAQRGILDEQHFVRRHDFFERNHLQDPRSSKHIREEERRIHQAEGFPERQSAPMSAPKLPQPMRSREVAWPRAQHALHDYREEKSLPSPAQLAQSMSRDRTDAQGQQALPRLTSHDVRLLFDYSSARLQFEKDRRSSFPEAQPPPGTHVKQGARVPIRIRDRGGESDYLLERETEGMQLRSSARETSQAPHRVMMGKDSSTRRDVTTIDSPMPQRHRQAQGSSLHAGGNLRYFPAQNARGPAHTVNNGTVIRESPGRYTTLNDLRVLQSQTRHRRPSLSNASNAEGASHTITQSYPLRRHAYHPRAHNPQMEESRRTFEHTVDLSPDQRARAHDSRFQAPKEQIQMRLDRVPASSALREDQERGLKRQHGPDTFVRERNRQSQPGRCNRVTFPALPPVSAGDGLRRSVERPRSSLGAHQFESSMHQTSEGKSKIGTVTPAQRPFEARVGGDIRDQGRMQDPCYRRAPSAGVGPTEGLRGVESHAPVIASQHTRPSGEISAAQPPSAPRPFKRRRAGSDTSLVLKSFRLPNADA